MADASIFEDTFNITSIDNKVYDRVTRLNGTSTDNTVTMNLDINHELFPCAEGDTINLVLANTLRLDGSKDDGGQGWREVGKGESTLADMYDYVCFGKVYRVVDQENEGNDVKVYISFGGLLLVMQGPYRKLTGLKIEHLYLLVKK
ncbi:RNA polymerase [Massarina eburnea CBS 473.64]|uniref:DNA-directed RNA polymerases I, II, and III subunit RPABC3 n=1 Tax=Massarina eburnea CBS 473.64 TaxID=1395130 RepID=A0A6A6SF15_9PLEO|nr:RNA polymerase [Massarina eburnea CBS 473.64]